ncbi:MAG TPA: winged helix-turn-helix domain-containing protein [Actinophytocola sp.]|uniref:winged helix-turn-helix domain-containing protein n=1 Tax=Actinophytocola sp. TaxID=1872138 RepID=UPI002DBE237D|nr:winged helix-turn-helix domain-containing protein [Actinophytocola sp.]HEU5476151.1 winged helix-turn-helix domain-containing protein [Actinophytocola sp.]
MPSKPRRTITDPKELRALAHPLRWKLLELINREGRATATQCAREVGESVANCSYHLNILAKYDYIEAAEGGAGREKPWRVVHEGHNWTDLGLDIEGALAAEAASEAYLEFSFAEIRRRLRVASLEPDHWREAIGASDSNEFLTAAEVLAMQEEIRAIMQRHRDRRDNPELRPEGARPVHFFLTTTVPPKPDK